MCREEPVSLQDRASITELVAWIATAAFAALMILTLVSGCMSIRNCVIKIDNKSGTVSIGNKDVQIPVTATVPTSEVMQ